VAECDHPEVTMREGWDVMTPGAHGVKLELEGRDGDGRQSHMNRWDVETERNERGELTAARL